MKQNIYFFALLVSALLISSSSYAESQDKAVAQSKTEPQATVTRYPLPNNSTFPIARAVEVIAGTNLVYHSGNVPSAADPSKEKGSRAYYGDTETQAHSVFKKLESSLNDIGLGFKDVIKMTVFIVGDPAKEGKMDFAGFMKAYTQYFGTQDQPNLPARSAIQIAGLAGGPGMLIEIELVAARPQANWTVRIDLV